MKKEKMLAAVLLAGCMFAASPLSAQEQTVRLTTARAAGSEVTLMLNKVGGLSVDWGDGTFVPVEKGTDAVIEVTGKVLGPEIVVKGGASFTLLGCAGNDLTAIDASGATGLRSLYCQHNKLESLNISGLTGLTDLNCADNALESLPLDEKKFPEMEVVNVSGNKLGGTFAIRQDRMQYLDISNNKYTRVYVNSDPNLKVLICSHNELSSSLSLNANVGNLSAVVCNGNALPGISVNVSSGLPSLRTLVCDDNKLGTLNLSQSESLSYLSCQRNELTLVDLHSKARPAVMHCGHNRLTFASFPSVAPAIFSAEPQADIDLTKEIKEAGGHDYMPLCPSYSERNNYSLNMDAYRRDASGLTVVQFSCFRSSDDGTDTQLERGTSSSAPKDYTNTSGKLAFYKPMTGVYVQLTNPRYPDFTLKTMRFAVGEPTGIGQAPTADGLTVSASNGTLTLSGTTPQTVHVYTVAGKAVWTGRVDAGSVSLSLPKGVYVVNGRKVIL